MKRRLLTTLPFALCALVLVGSGSCRKAEEEAVPEDGGPGAEDVAGAEETVAWTGDSFTLRVRVAGLVAMVPSSSGKSLGLLMIDAGAPASASNGCVIPAHNPAVEWQAGRCEGGPDNAADWCAGATRPLAEEDLQLAVLGHGGPPPVPGLDLGGFADPIKKPAGSSPHRVATKPKTLAPEWTVRVGELYPAGQVPVVNESCFWKVPGLDCPVVARLRLDHGALGTCRLAEIGKPRVTWTYGFKPLDPAAAQADFTPRTVGAVTEVAWQVEGTGLRLAGFPFGDEEEGEVITLQPDPSGEIVLQFVNLVDASGHEAPAKGCDATELDYHFEYLYSIAANQPDVIQVPYRVTKLEEDVQPDCDLLKPLPAAAPTPGDITACAKLAYPPSGSVEALPATGFPE